MMENKEMKMDDEIKNNGSLSGDEEYEEEYEEKYDHTSHLPDGKYIMNINMRLFVLFCVLLSKYLFPFHMFDIILKYMLLMGYLHNRTNIIQGIVAEFYEIQSIFHCYIRF